MAFGLALKSLSFFLRFIEFCCAAIILGIFSYFLAKLHDHGLHIDTYIRAVEGISGAGVLYTIFALLLVCCLGGIAFFGFLAMLLDLAFTGAFIYVAYATRGGAGSCRGNVNTPLGSGDANTSRATGSVFDGLPSLHTSCKLNTACFSVAVVAAVFFFISVFVEFGLTRVHKKEKAYGPSPNNGYTAGKPKRKFWQRKNKNVGADGLAEKPDALPAHQTPADFRTSYATDATAVGAEPAFNKYGNGANMSGAQTVGTTHGYQTTTTTSTGGYTPYRSEVV